MSALHGQHRALLRLDELARIDSLVHRLDPRVKVIVTIAFAAIVVSFDKYQIAPLLPFALFPVWMAAASRIPLGFIVLRALPALPLILCVALFNPLFDTRPMARIGWLELSGGWVSFLSISLRGLLTVFAALVLVATTGMDRVCNALERMGAPRVFAVQLMFLYRYLFVLVDEASRMSRARGLRSFRANQATLAVFGSMAGQLLLRTLDRSQRIGRAMYSRGFDGTVRTLHQARFRPADLLFLLVWAAALAAMRLLPIPRLIADLILQVFP